MADKIDDIRRTNYTLTHKREGSQYTNAFHALLQRLVLYI
jgi:hypothetical protein